MGTRAGRDGRSPASPCSRLSMGAGCKGAALPLAEASRCYQVCGAKRPGTLLCWTPGHLLPSQERERGPCLAILVHGAALAHRRCICKSAKSPTLAGTPSVQAGPACSSQPRMRFLRVQCNMCRVVLTQRGLNRGRDAAVGGV